MILHCSQKLAAKLTDVSAAPLEEISPLGSWHAHLMIYDRRQCVMFMHDATRYALFLPDLRKPQFAALGEWFRSLYFATLASFGCPDTQIKKVELAIGAVRFDTATDRCRVRCGWRSRIWQHCSIRCPMCLTWTPWRYPASSVIGR